MEMLSDMGSTPIISTIWNRKDRLDGLSFLLDRVDKQDFADISKAEVSEIYLHVSQDMQQDARCKFWALAVLLCGLCMRSGQSVLHRSGEAWRKGQQREA